MTHDLRAPTGTAFKLGFGVSAGIFTFRALVLLVVGTLLLVAATRLLDFLS